MAHAGPPPLPGFGISTDRGEGTTRLALRGELDLATLPHLEAALEEVSGNGDRLVLDLRELSFLDSSGLRGLLAAHARCQSERRELTILRGPESVERVFALTGTDELLPLADEVPAATA